ncbi:methyl-accepting chemotaxis protein [Ureibacillus thermophilus]|nr:methyl-accepting chemotaxis protein [Ureibacillus thermophilus]
MTVPEELYGFSIKLIAVPITDENNKVIGSISVSTNQENHSKLLKVAEQFAASAEEISASTEELSASANNFNSYIEKLSESQKEMTKQVEDSAKILELINNVAKNTRILGFNAGIEAARAGEYGKGFSVVAKEITKLAEQSADSVNEIRNLLEQLKDKVKQVAAYVNSTVEVSSNQTSALNDISNSIQNIAHVAEEIEQMAQKIF